MKNSDAPLPGKQFVSTRRAELPRQGVIGSVFSPLRSLIKVQRENLREVNSEMRAQIERASIGGSTPSATREEIVHSRYAELFTSSGGWATPQGRR